MKFQSMLILITIMSLTVGCDKISLNLSTKEGALGSSSLEPKVTRVEVENNQLILTGNNMTKVHNLKVSGNDYKFILISKTANKLIYAVEGVALLNMNAISNLIISSAHASSNVPIAVSLCSTDLAGKQIDCSVAPTNNQVLAFDQGTNKWKPMTMAGGVNLVLNQSEPYACDATKLGKIELDPDGNLCSCSRSLSSGLAWRSTNGVCTFEKIELCPTTVASSPVKNLHESYSCYCDPGTLDNNNTIYGNNIYSQRSSICQTAIFGGFIDYTTGGEVTYTVIRGRDSYASGDYSLDSNITSKTDSSSPLSMILGSMGGRTYGCKEPSYTNSTDCVAAGRYFQGSGVYGTCYRKIPLHQVPDCSDWDIIDDYNVM